MGVRTFLNWAVILTPILFTMNKSHDAFNIGVFTAFTCGLLAWQGAREMAFILLAALASYVLTGMHPVSTGAMLMLSAFGIAVIVISKVKDFDLYPALAVACSVGMVSTVLERLGWSFFTPSTEPGGLLGNAPQLCLILCLLIPFVAYRGYYAIALGLAVVSLALGEMTGAVAWLVTRILINWDEKRRLLVILAGGALGALFFHREIVQAASVRLPIWSATIMQIAKQPLTGYGPGVFDSVSGQFITGYWHAENSFSSILQAVFNCGVLMLAAIAYAVKKIWESPDSPERAALLVLAVLALFEYPVEISKFWPVYAVIVGVFLSKTKEVENAG